MLRFALSGCNHLADFGDEFSQRLLYSDLEGQIGIWTADAGSLQADGNFARCDVASGQFYLAAVFGNRFAQLIQHLLDFRPEFLGCFGHI